MSLQVSNGFVDGPFSKPLAVYVHIPFCQRRCRYCDFPTFAGRDAEMADYALAVEAQIASSPFAGESVGTVYFGGGTPTHMPADILERILRRLADTFAVEPDAEITFEANPASSSLDIFKELRAAGFNRVSIGVQALDDTLLATLGRLHTAEEARLTLEAAREARFLSVNADLMFGIPGQTVEGWVSQLEALVSMGVPHIATYCLTVEEGTSFAEMIAQGLIQPMDDDLATDMYEAAMDVLKAAGYEHYEVSNFALRGHRCRHNMVYWRNEPYLGLGAAAASYMNGERSVAVADPAEYVARIRSGRSVVASSERLPPSIRLGETLMLALRLSDGFAMDSVQRSYGDRASGGVSRAMASLVKRNLLAEDHGRVRLTRTGLLFADDVIAELMAQIEESLRADSNR